jgi:hypothetical protein
MVAKLGVSHQEKSKDWGSYGTYCRGERLALRGLHDMRVKQTAQ